MTVQQATMKARPRRVVAAADWGKMALSDTPASALLMACNLVADVVGRADSRVRPRIMA